MWENLLVDFLISASISFVKSVWRLLELLAESTFSLKISRALVIIIDNSSRMWIKQEFVMYCINNEKKGSTLTMLFLEAKTLQFVGLVLGLFLQAASSWGHLVFLFPTFASRIERHLTWRCQIIDHFAQLVQFFTDSSQFLRVGRQVIAIATSGLTTEKNDGINQLLTPHFPPCYFLELFWFLRHYFWVQSNFPRFSWISSISWPLR